MKKDSITFKLLFFIVAAFSFTTISILLMADIELTKIIDRSQKIAFAEKIETIYGLIQRKNEQLKKTGLVEAYFNDFQHSTLEILKKSNYNRSDLLIYPFIIDTNGIVVMHPKLPSGDISLVGSEVTGKMLAENQGEFNYSYLGQKKWCVFKHFPEWNWVIAYTVPLDLKYGDARKFRKLLIFIMGGITFVVLLVLSLIVTRFTQPITNLTRAAKAIAEGKLDQQIDSGGKDEVGILAHSFVNMRDSIQQKISALIKENSERRKAEETLSRQNEYIYNIIESLTHPFYVIDVNDYSIQLANSASGFKAGDKYTCYGHIRQGDSPCNSDEQPCPLEGIRQSKKPAMVEHVNYDADGSPRNIEVHAYPVFNQDGDLTQMIEYGIDVTLRKQAQAELAAEKERLSVTLRSIGDGVITTDISGKITLLNKVAENLTGWSSDEACGRHLEEVFHIINEKTRAVCENPVNKVLASSQIVGLANHTALIAKDGREIAIADSGAPIQDDLSRIIGVVLVFRDVTEQIKTEQTLMKMQKIESVGVLAGGIAHDFNNILAAILGNINLAQFDETLTERTRKLLAEAEKASLRAKGLTQQLLTFSRGGDPIKETSSLKNVIMESAGFVLRGDKVTCQYDIPDDLWLADIDKGQISQVVQNIVLNARNAMPKGGVLQIECKNLDSMDQKSLYHGKNKKFVKISFHDTGIGISSELIDKIFDPYFSTKSEGSGLGLAICHSIINKHNGYISVDSLPGKGTTFNVYLPVSVTPPAQLSSTIDTPTDSESARILFMDDDEMVRNIAREMLTYLGHEVVSANDGNTAIELYQKAIDSGDSFDLVIMDLTIPGGMGGAEAVQRLRQINHDAKVVVTSGYSNDPIMANYTQYGFCATLVKPFQTEDLSKVLSQVLMGDIQEFV
nr:PAS domain S-box protein [Desulfobulbaceae bacterium]